MVEIITYYIDRTHQLAGMQDYIIIIIIDVPEYAFIPMRYKKMMKLGRLAFFYSLQSAAGMQGNNFKFTLNFPLTVLNKANMRPAGWWSMHAQRGQEIIHVYSVDRSVNSVLHRVRLTGLMIKAMWTWLSVHQDPVLIDRWRVPRTWLLSQSKPFVC